MSEPSGRGRPGNSRPGNGKPGSGKPGSSRPGDSWDKRAADLASGVQRWLIKTSARNMRDELGDQVRRAFRGDSGQAGDVWETATTEPPRAADEPPECAWCPVCRAARRLAEARAEASGGGGSRLGSLAEVMAGAVQDALSGLDSILSYRPGDGPAPTAPRPAEPAHSAADRADDDADRAGDPRQDQAKEPGHGHEPDDRG